MARKQAELKQPYSPLDDLISRLPELSLEELLELTRAVADIERKKREQVRRQLRAEFEQKAALLGMTAKEVVEPEPSKKSGRKLPVTHIGPNPGEEWRGRGKVPNWAKREIANGRTLEEFAVKP